MICSNCGKDIPDEASFCPYCMTKFVKGESIGVETRKRVSVKKEPKIVCSSNYKREYIILYTISIIMLFALLLIFVARNTNCAGDGSGKDEKKEFESETETIDYSNLSKEERVQVTINNIVNVYNDFLVEIIENDDADSYKNVIETFSLGKDNFIQDEYNEDIYYATYMQDGKELYGVALYFYGEGELGGIRIVTSYENNANGVEGAYECLRILSYGFMATVDENKSVDEIKDIFKGATMAPGNILAYDGIEYKAIEGDDNFKFDIYITRNEQNEDEETKESIKDTNKDNETSEMTSSKEQEEETTSKTAMTEKETGKEESTEETTTKPIQEDNADTEVKPIALGSFDDFDNLIEHSSYDGYKVTFDNEVFTMTSSVSGCIYSAYYGDEFLWSDENIVVGYAGSTVNSKGYCLINIIACEEFYEGNYSLHSSNENYQVQLQFNCETNSSYIYDFEESSELYKFVKKVADKLKELKPVDRGLPLSQITDISSIENKVSTLNEYRVNFDNETFKMRLSGNEPMTYIMIEYSNVIWYEGNIVMVQNISKSASGLESCDIYIYVLCQDYDETVRTYQHTDYTYSVRMCIDCLSSTEYEFDVMNSSMDLYGFIFNIIDKL